ncbi:hypothetical protein GCM10010409_40300 [Mycolicibacterium diernhoferi]
MTGSAAMPSTEPGPVGTCSAYAAQPLPTSAPAGAAIVVEGSGAIEEVIDSVMEDTEELASLLSVDDPEHADNPSAATAATPANAIRW